MSISLKNDVHLNPLYLKFAADNFRNGNTSEGIRFFELVCDTPRDCEHKVYKQLWKLNGRPDVPEYGRKTFFNIDEASFSSANNAEAIERVLRKTDQNELSMREHQVHKCLWILHGRPLLDLEYGNHAFKHQYGRSSTFEDKVAASKLYANESRVLSWLLDRHEVGLIRRADNELECLIIENHSGRICASTINRRGRSPEQVISALTGYDLTLNGDTPILSRSRECEYAKEAFITNQDSELRLLFGNDDHAIWRLYDKKVKTISCVRANIRLIQIIKTLGESLYDERTCFFKDYKIEVTKSQSKLVAVSIEKLQFKSIIDPNKTIDRDNWAITLIDSGRCKTDPSTWGGHAIIAYEGVRGGRQFLNYSDLCAPDGCENGEVRIMNNLDLYLKGIKVTICNKSETWIRDRVNVEHMEKLIHDDIGKIIPFAPLRVPFFEQAKAAFYELFGYKNEPQDWTDNCLSWAVIKATAGGVLLPLWSDISILPKQYVTHLYYHPSSVKLMPRDEGLAEFNFIFSPSFNEHLSVIN